LSDRTYHKGSVGSLPGEEISVFAAHAMYISRGFL
jgi:hypothetical protein